MDQLEWQIGTVIEKIAEISGVYSIGIELPEWKGHLAGQHVDVRLTAEDGYQAQRSYSIASPPGETLVWLTVERLEDGEVSSYLADELRTGDLIELRGPIGGYFVWDGKADGETHAPLFLIAGGSGIVPLMAMIRDRHNTHNQTPVRLLYSARTQSDIIYRAELDRLSAKKDGFEVFYTFTRDRPFGWNGYNRRVDRKMLQESAFPQEERPDIFICGPTPFVENAADLMRGLGHEFGNIKTERFGPTGE